MAVSSLLIRLDTRLPPTQTVQALRHWNCLTLGPLSSPLLPAVLDTPSPQQDRLALNRLLDLPGIAHVDVLSVVFLDEEGPLFPTGGSHEPSP